LLQATVDGVAAFERVMRWNDFQHDDVGTQVRMWLINVTGYRLSFLTIDVRAGLHQRSLRLQLDC
jgi:hypothetical protein